MSARSSFATRLRAGPLGGFVRRVPVGFMRELFWRELRDNAVSLRGLPPTTRVLGTIGFVLLGIMVATLVFNDVWRAYPLMDAPPGQSGRGTLVPTALLPVTLFLVSVACAFMLCGAMRARPAVAGAVLVPFLVLAGRWSTGARTAGGIDFSATWDSVIAWGPLALIPIVFLVRRWGRSRPGLDFCVMLILVAAVLAAGQDRLLELDRTSMSLSQSDNTIVETRATILLLSALVLPLLVFIGVDIADFAHRVADWTVAMARETRRAWLIVVLLVLGLAWQLVAGVTQVSEDVADGGALGRYAGALGVPLLVGAAWWLFVGRRPPGTGPDADVRPGPEAVTDMGRGVTLWLILAYYALDLGTSLAVLGMQTLFKLGFGGPGMVGRWQDVERLADHAWLWTAGVDLVVLGVAALWVRRRGRRLLALYLALVALLHLWSELTEPGRLLGALSFDQDAANLWWVAGVGAAAAMWLVRGRMTAARAQALLLILTIVVLLGQTDLLEDPFAPFVLFSGIAIIALGLVWDVLSFGPWVNRESPGLPRASRLFIYLGYGLFGVTLINWSLTAHVLSELEFYSGGGALQGFAQFGTPLLYVVFGVVLAGVVRERRPADPAAG